MPYCGPDSQRAYFTLRHRRRVFDLLVCAGFGGPPHRNLKGYPMAASSSFPATQIGGVESIGTGPVDSPRPLPTSIPVKCCISFAEYECAGHDQLQS